MAPAIPAKPAAQSPRHAPSQLARGLRTFIAVAAGCAFGSAHAAGTGDGLAQWHDVIYILAPALAALIEAVAERIAGRIRRRRST
jgi:hypothetical protein